MSEEKLNLRKHKLSCVRLPIDSLVMLPNPRVHPEKEIDGLVESIKKYGFYAPVFVSAVDNTLLAGYARVEAVKRLGLKYIDAIKLNIQPEEYSMVMILDNRLSEMASWNYQLFIETLEKNIDTSVDLPPELGMSLEELTDLRHWLDESMSSGIELAQLVDDTINQVGLPSASESQGKIVEITLSIPLNVWENIRVELDSDLVSLVLKFKDIKVATPKIRRKR